MHDFKRTVRVPLPEWGTDASDLTIWRRVSSQRKADGDAGGNGGVDSSEGAQRPLVECAAEGCGAPAAWRCRLARGLCYCSAVCLQNDLRALTSSPTAPSSSSASSAAMALQMIPLPTPGSPAATCAAPGAATGAAAQEPALALALALSLEEPRHFNRLVVGGTSRAKNKGGGAGEAASHATAGAGISAGTGPLGHAVTGAEVGTATGTKKRKRKKKKKGPRPPDAELASGPGASIDGP